MKRIRAQGRIALGGIVAAVGLASVLAVSASTRDQETEENREVSFYVVDYLDMNRDGAQDVVGVVRDSQKRNSPYVGWIDSSERIGNSVGSEFKIEPQVIEPITKTILARSKHTSFDVIDGILRQSVIDPSGLQLEPKTYIGESLGTFHYVVDLDGIGKRDLIFVENEKMGDVESGDYLSDMWTELDQARDEEGRVIWFYRRSLFPQPETGEMQNTMRRSLGKSNISIFYNVL